MQTFLLIALAVSNFLWFCWFTGYRKGVREAIDEHNEREHKGEPRFLKMKVESKTFKEGQGNE